MSLQRSWGRKANTDDFSYFRHTEYIGFNWLDFKGLSAA